jgi:hypothetical protein
MVFSSHVLTYLMGGLRDDLVAYVAHVGYLGLDFFAFFRLLVVVAAATAAN